MSKKRFYVEVDYRTTLTETHCFEIEAETKEEAEELAVELDMDDPAFLQYKKSEADMKLIGVDKEVTRKLN